MSSSVPNLSPREAAALLGVSQATVKRWALHGHLQATKTPSGWWKFARADIDAFIEAHRYRAAVEVTA